MHWRKALAWKIEFTSDAAKQLQKIGEENKRRILSFLRERVVENPRLDGKPLKGSQREFWRYRVGDFRVLAHIEDERVVVLVVHISHQREIYR